jgi:hypothetical protein
VSRFRADCYPLSGDRRDADLRRRAEADQSRFSSKPWPDGGLLPEISSRHAALKLSNGSSPAVGARHPYRGAGLDVVWQPFVVLFVIGAMLFGYALARFRGTIGMMV